MNIRPIFFILLAFSSIFSSSPEHKPFYRNCAIFVDDGCEEIEGNSRAVLWSVVSSLGKAEHPFIVSADLWHLFCELKAQFEFLAKDPKSDVARVNDRHIILNERIAYWQQQFASLAKIDPTQAKSLIVQQINDELWYNPSKEQVEKNKNYPENSAYAANLVTAHYLPVSLNEWKVYLLNDDFYLFIPQAYERSCGECNYGDNSELFDRSSGYSDQERRLGLRVDHLTQLQDPACLSFNAFERRIARRSVGSCLQALQQAFVENHDEIDGSWNIYLLGHGINDPIWKFSAIADIEVNEFSSILDFFNMSMQVHMLAYQSCYSGGQHLVVPYECADEKKLFNFSIVCFCLNDVVGYVCGIIKNYLVEKEYDFTASDLELLGDVYVVTPYDLVEYNKLFEAMSANSDAFHDMLIKKAYKVFPNRFSNTAMIRLPATNSFIPLLKNNYRTCLKCMV